VVHQRFAVGAVDRRDSDADACADENAAAFDIKRFGEDLDNPLRRRASVFRSLQTADEDREFIAA